jgi:hypothetical protein
MKTLKILILLAVILIYTSLITRNIIFLGLAELIAIPSIIILFIKQKKLSNKF